MENTFQNDELFRAKNKLKKLKDFMGTWFYIVFNSVLVINLVTYITRSWFYWFLVGELG
jgi:hypothetical protein